MINKAIVQMNFLNESSLKFDFKTNLCHSKIGKKGVDNLVGSALKEL